MVDRDARRRLALLLRRLGSGRITTQDYDDEYSWSAEDAGTRAAADFGWSLYADGENHRLVGGNALHPEWRRILARCVVFLSSDCEYRWPAAPEVTLRQVLPSLLTLGILDGGFAEAQDTWRAKLDMNVWPFGDTTELGVAVGTWPFRSA